MVDLNGLEPSTFWLQTSCAPNCARDPRVVRAAPAVGFGPTHPCGHLGLTVRCFTRLSHTRAATNKKNGGPGRIRTFGLWRVVPARYHCATGPFGRPHQIYLIHLVEEDEVVPREGFEPPTPSSSGKRSTGLSYHGTMKICAAGRRGFGPQSYLVQVHAPYRLVTRQRRKVTRIGARRESRTPTS